MKIEDLLTKIAHQAAKRQKEIRENQDDCIKMKNWTGASHCENSLSDLEDIGLYLIRIVLLDNDEELLAFFNTELVKAGHVGYP